jgi:hypothetical protein
LAAAAAEGDAAGWGVPRREGCRGAEAAGDPGRLDLPALGACGGSGEPETKRPSSRELRWRREGCLGLTEAEPIVGVVAAEVGASLWAILVRTGGGGGGGTAGACAGGFCVAASWSCLLGEGEGDGGGAEAVAGVGGSGAGAAAADGGDGGRPIDGGGDCGAATNDCCSACAAMNSWKALCWVSSADCRAASCVKRRA